MARLLTAAVLYTVTARVTSDISAPMLARNVHPMSGTILNVICAIIAAFLDVTRQKTLRQRVVSPRLAFAAQKLSQGALRSSQRDPFIVARAPTSERH